MDPCLLERVLWSSLLIHHWLLAYYLFFWEQGFWKEHLRGKSYHIRSVSAYVEIDHKLDMLSNNIFVVVNYCFQKLSL